MSKMVRTLGAASVKPVKNRTAGGRPPKNGIAQAKAGTSASIKVPKQRPFNRVANPIKQASKNLNSAVPRTKAGGAPGSPAKTPSKGRMGNYFKDATAGTGPLPLKPKKLPGGNKAQ